MIRFLYSYKFVRSTLVYWIRTHIVSPGSGPARRFAWISRPTSFRLDPDWLKSSSSLAPDSDTDSTSPDLKLTNFRKKKVAMWAKKTQLTLYSVYCNGRV